MKYLILVLTLLLAISDSRADLQKCTSPSGKITFTDSACPNSTSTSSVKTRDNTIDTAGLRKEGARLSDREEVENLRANPPPECRFKFFTMSDEKGKVLAENAKMECIQNLRASKTGGAVSKEAYSLWKDHYEQTSHTRQTNLERSAKQLDAVNKSFQTPASREGDKKLTCKPNIMGTALNCE